MKKKTYEKPTCSVYELKHHTMILCASDPQSTPPDVEETDGWLGYAPGIDTNGNHLA